MREARSYRVMHDLDHFATSLSSSPAVSVLQEKREDGFQDSYGALLVWFKEVFLDLEWTLLMSVSSITSPEHKKIP